MQAMVTIGVRELRQNASRYLRLVKAGQRVAVTDRGTLVAYLIPAGMAASIVDRLAAAGEYTPPAGRLSDIAAPPKATAGALPLSEVLSEMRDEERG
jgi:prevent-host-death family protein